ncbi:heavy metal translocating P-type ATPase [Achromobacter aloeverae]|uniref:P-type Zn(2+) transporter n=1 Tax=Achromobacter aloeverae TaxID=1750518 RepID=A0A4Q1HNE9_9BURK|nr:heavy metal translocating P-type ATPase [Achromobacter aloeverae]RXN92211.1 heavy metal translocating P-type ATPase [Achromobacter aloeverae]
MRNLRLNILLLATTVLALGIGGFLYWIDALASAHATWTAGSLPALACTACNVYRALARREMGADALALIAIVGAIVLGEALSACIIAAMFTSGQVLESWAEDRAGREMSALLARVPRTAWKVDGTSIVSIDLAAIKAGDILLVKPGDIVPVDGLVLSATATLDESVLTGESTAVERRQGSNVRSGAVNAGGPFNLVASETAERSTFAGISKLIEAARSARAPAARLADKAAAWLIPLALGLAAIAWAVSGDPRRALAVLVVATPCPLILAVPVALVCGMSNCARRGILVKGGGALENLARATILFFDKTGTVTGGRARIAYIKAAKGEDKTDVLRTAAAVDQMSAHITATVIVATARERQLQLEMPQDVVETHGAGVSATLGGIPVRVGTPDFVCKTVPWPEWAREFLKTVGEQGGSGVFVAKGDRVMGALHLADQVRLETPRALRLLRRAGIRRMVMLTGDRRDVGEAIGSILGVDEVCAELDPAGKVAAIAQAPSASISIMVGDGVNDAPALASASVGIAMGARGAAAASEAADVVLLVDRFDRLADAMELAKATRRIAVQSVSIGMGLSLVAMMVAALGYLPPVYGAALQELIDVVAIMNALRALRAEPSRPTGRRLAAEEARRWRDQHEKLMPVLDRLSSLGGRVLDMSAAQAGPVLQEIDQLISEKILSHEREDEAVIYPVVAELLGGEDPLAPLSRTHREIAALSRELHRDVVAFTETGSERALRDIQRLLYSLAAILELHFAQEEEMYLAVS